jgi:hypothetical protein
MVEIIILSEYYVLESKRKETPKMKKNNEKTNFLTMLAYLFAAGSNTNF